MNNTQSLYKCTSLLFIVAAVASGVGRSHDFGMAAVWTAIGVIFWVIGSRRQQD